MSATLRPVGARGVRSLGEGGLWGGADVAPDVSFGKIGGRRWVIRATVWVAECQGTPP